MSAIVNPRDLLMQAAPSRLLPVTLPDNVIIPALVPDYSAVPTPTGFGVSAAISNIFVEHDNPVFIVGHGYLRTNVYGALWMGGALPVFADAVRITSFAGQVTSHATNPALVWHLWITWVSRDGVESLPAGGVNGLVATTGQDVERMVAAMTGPGNPFTVLDVDTVIDGVLFPAGTYSSKAFIADAQISNAKIKNLAVDDAKIASLSVTKLLAGTLGVNQYIESANYSAENGTGFRLHADGTLSLPNGSVTAANINGTNLEVVNGTFSGELFGATGTFSGSLTTDALNAVNTINIADQAITFPVGAYTAGTVTLQDGSEVVQTLLHTASGTGGLTVAASFLTTHNVTEVNAKTETFVYITVRRVRVSDNATTKTYINSARICAFHSNNGVTMGFGAQALSFVDTSPPAGEHRYEMELEVMSNYPDGSAPIGFQHRMLQVVELKK